MEKRLSLSWGKAALVLVVLFFMVGCAGTESPKPVLLSQVRPVADNLERVTLSIRKADLKAAIERGEAVNTIRMIRLFRRGGPGPYQFPEYRLFDIQAGSVFTLLGLQNADVLVALNDYVLYDPTKFPVYVRLLQNETDAQIEIRRGEQPVLLQYQFLE